MKLKKMEQMLFLKEPMQYALKELQVYAAPVRFGGRGHGLITHPSRNPPQMFRLYHS